MSEVEKGFIPFCANKLCANNEIIVRSNEYGIGIRIHIRRHGKDIEIDRHLYVNKYGERVALCSVCHAAHVIVNRT